MTTTLPRSRSGTGDRARPRTRPTPAASVPPQAVLAGATRRSSLGAAGAAGPAAGHGRALPLGPRRPPATPTATTPPPFRPGRKSWKALFFGSLDASNFITVDKPPGSLWVMGLSGRLFGFNSWSMLVPQALEGRGDGRAAVRDGAAVVRPGRRAADRRGHGAHAGRGAHVPLQQPGRAARPVARRRRLRADPRAGEGGHALAAARRGARRVRLPDQDAAGVPGAARLRAGLPRRRADPAATAPLADARGRGGDGRGRRLVGRHRGAVAGGESSLHRRVDQQQRPRPGVRLQRTEPPQRRRRARRRPVRRPAAVPAVAAAASAARPGSPGCSTTRSAARSPGCCPRP